MANHFQQIEDTNQRLIDALCFFVKKNDKKISVAKICRKSGVSRNTFYLHYQDVDELISFFENSILKDFEEYLNENVSHELNGEDHTRDVLKLVLRYFEDNKDLYSWVYRLNTRKNVELYFEVIKKYMFPCKEPDELKYIESCKPVLYSFASYIAACIEFNQPFVVEDILSSKSNLVELLTIKKAS